MIKGGSPNLENEWRDSVRNINRERKYKKEPTKLNTITEILKDIYYTHTHTHTHTHTTGNQCYRKMIWKIELWKSSNKNSNKKKKNIKWGEFKGPLCQYQV